MGNQGSSEPDKQNEYIVCDRPNNEGKPHAKLIFKFKNLTEEVANAATVQLPQSRDDKLVVTINGELCWNNQVYGEIDVKDSEVERKPGKSGHVMVKLAKKNGTTEDWPLEKWTAGGFN